jgi:hypothetical protein
VRRFIPPYAIMRGMIVLAVVCPPPISAQQAGGSALPAGPAFWNVSAGFVGSKRCATCHPAQAKHFGRNSMSHALVLAADAEVFRGDVHYGWKDGTYSYSISRSDGKVIYSVTDGTATFTTPLEYAFGQGEAGQTYVYRVDGVWYESRVSYYAAIKRLDATVGARNSAPPNLREAAGRAMPGHEARECFGCHTTGARRGAALQLDNFEGGVQCESCHGPGSEHIADVERGKLAPNSIRSLKGMDAEETSEFCGVCHRTFDAIVIAQIRGVNNVRFAPYRLANSKCFSADDSRIACTACHDPHAEVITSDTYYDAKCGACHNAGNSALKKRMCPVAKQACTSCHMPRIEPPEAHHAFADHDIRVVRSKGDYPG